MWSLNVFLTSVVHRWLWPISNEIDIFLRKMMHFTYISIIIWTHKMLIPVVLIILYLNQHKYNMIFCFFNEFNYRYKSEMFSKHPRYDWTQTQSFRFNTKPITLHCKNFVMKKYHERNLLLRIARYNCYSVTLTQGEDFSFLNEFLFFFFTGS